MVKDPLKKKKEKVVMSWSNESDEDEVPEAISTSYARDQALAQRENERQAAQSQSQKIKKKKKRKKKPEESENIETHDDENETEEPSSNIDQDLLLPEDFIQQVLDEQEHQKQQRKATNQSKSTRARNASLQKKSFKRKERSDNFDPVELSSLGSHGFEIPASAKNFLQQSFQKPGRRMNYNSFASKKGIQPSSMFRSQKNNS
mmetsp:Transcript_33334/g.43990  ORF Transcript_33334/g.43990 Transcript_33334/m.43990 type:complete len:203 (+) Transcript_33334:127-735(+)|eukprot:CAMPEP_0117756280 /NCGR_PEP_ID=MMETSP0947-20121206/13977_1 /TAXON_ID=44440 /ORGANISM="Chattonella subsalsa, Strain CCMP2191" /LENGTH=202 /DNA_ID=CAMNT_0005575823 /DNA_START=55 /DNA_END=663 /DNA_ORIENTATION=+